MIFQPVLHPILLLLLVAPVAVVVVRALVKAARGERGVWALRVVLLLACVAVLLRPGIPGGSSETLAANTDIVLVVDTTASIVGEDWAEGQPRLEGVREDVQAIVDEYPGARFALIVFDANATLRLPLTTDTTALSSSLAVLRPEVTSQSRGSSIGIANTLLAQTLQRAADSAPDRSRMVFYFGDGEQTVSTDPESFKSSAKYVDGGSVLGYGTEAGGPMKLTTGSVDGPSSDYIEYEGAKALSVIDEANLQMIASELGVDYQHRDDATALVLPKSPSVTSYASAGIVGNVVELYWIAALLIVLLLGWELARATMLIVQLRGESAPRRGLDSATRAGKGGAA